MYKNMKKTSLIVAITVSICITIFATMAFTSKSAEKKVSFKQITAIESVLPGGLGRSRIITTDLSGSKLEETKLENFYSLVGINFSNIMQNDLTITSKLAELSNQGWELTNVSVGVESSVEKTGLFITRYLFRKTE